MNYLFLADCLSLTKFDRNYYDQNMQQSNIALLPQWRAAGNTGDLPIGWNGNGGGVSTGNDQANSLIQQQAAATAANNAAQEAKQNDFINQFKAAVAAQPTIAQSADTIGQRLGLPTLQANAQTLNNQLQNIPQQQTTATRGYDVNSNQLARIIGQKQSELAPAATQAAQNAGNAESNLSTQLGYQTQQNALDLQPLQMQGSMLSSQIAAEMTGFNQDKQTQLTLVTQQISNGQAVSMAQLQQANDLAKQKLAFDQAQQQVQQSISVAPGNSVYNPNTGQFVSQAPPKPMAATGTGKAVTYK